MQGRLSLLILIVGFAGVGWLATHKEEDGPAQPATVEFRQLSAAVNKTSNLLGSRSTISASMEIPQLGAQMQMNGEAVFNAKTNRSSMTMSGGVPGYPEASISISAVSEDNRIYLSSPQLTGELPAGKTWMMMELPEVASAGEMNFDPRSELQQLQETSSEVHSVGSERIGGVRTTRYDGITDMDLAIEDLRDQGYDEAADQLEALSAEMPDEMPYSVWIDKRSLIRRVTMEMPFDAVAGDGATMTMTMEFSDFGIEPQVDLPPASAVYDASALGNQYLDQLTG